MKKLFILLISLFLMVPVVSAEQPISVYIDGKKQSYSQPPVIQKGTTLVPLRGIFEKLGSKVDWNSGTKTVTAVKGNTKIVLKIGSTKPTVNGVTKTISIPAQIINSSTMVPLRFVSEALGAHVHWDGAVRKITIISSNGMAPIYDVVLEFPANLYPETAAHIKAAIARGESAICTIDPDGAEENRKESLKGIPTKAGFDRDEWPMAMCAEGGAGADVAYVTPSDNRGAGAWIANQLEKYPDGTRVLFKIVGQVTATPKPATPSKPSVDLTKDDYNCSDFKTQAEAQAVYEKSLKLYGKDVYKLDNDRDGRVCEGLK